jgi:hypothetical protein
LSPTKAPERASRSRRATWGLKGGRAYADLSKRLPGFVVRVPLGAARAWDLADKLP